MATESIKFILEAEDMATAKMRDFSENTVKQLRDVGSQTKASTELAGTLANTLGGSAFGSAAGQLAQLTERMSAFSEVAKAGSAGALAFKAGMVGAAAVAGYTLGRAIYDLAAGTSELKEKMEEAADAARELGSALNSQAINDLKQTKELFDLTGKSADEFGQLLTERILQQTDHLSTLKAELEEVNEAWYILETSQETERAKMLEAQIESSEDLLRSLKAQRAEVANQNSELAKSIELEKQRLAEDKKYFDSVNKADDSIAKLQQEVTLAKLKGDEAIRYKASLIAITQPQQQELERLMRQKQLIDEKAKAEQEMAAAKKQALAEEQATLKQTANLYKNAVDGLTKQFAQVKFGDEVARAFELSQSGLDDSSAKMIARVEAMLSDASSLDSVRSQVAPDVSATESRLLGGGGKTIDKAEVAAREQQKRDAERDKILRESNKLMRELISRGVVLEEVAAL